MTLTIDLTPAEGARLDAVAAQKGWDRTEAARRVLTANLPPMPAFPSPPANRAREVRLVEEYQALCDQEDDGTLPGAQVARLRQVEQVARLRQVEQVARLRQVEQVARLRQVEAELDRLEDQDPTEQEADRRLQKTGDKLDEILTLLRSLPRKDAAG